MIINVQKINEVYIRVSSYDAGIEQELMEYYEFFVPNYRFMPSYKTGIWDGKIRLYNKQTKLLYYGLLDSLYTFANKRKYMVQADPGVAILNAFTEEDCQNFIESLDLPFEPRHYQINAFRQAVTSHRKTFLCPTASGKSLIIYLITQYYKKKTLIIVPTVALVHQMADDFKVYSKNPDFKVHKIFQDQTKSTNDLITISTWQSLFRDPVKFFNQFEVVLGDECHAFKSTSLINIMTKLEKCKYRFGFTGTLDGSLTHERVISGLFGSVEVITTTKELIKEKHLADFKIKCLVLKYNDEECKLIKDFKYADEIGFLLTHKLRNDNIKKLALHAKGNTLVLFQYIEHGKKLYNLIKAVTERPIYFISGAVDGEVRNEIRKIVETQENAIIVASVGVFSVGINIVSLKNIIFASPTKSRIRTLQSIGRVLRKSNTKTQSVLFDIADDLTWKKKYNFSLKHFSERLKIYNSEKFDYKIYNLRLNQD